MLYFHTLKGLGQVTYCTSAFVGLCLGISYRAVHSPAWMEARYGRLWEQGLKGIERYNRLYKVEPRQRALEDLGKNGVGSLYLNYTSVHQFKAGVVPMPRKRRFFLPNVPVHAVQRGNNRGGVFFDENDYRVYLGWLAEAAREHGCSVHVYVLMTNHVHLLMTPTDGKALSATLQALGRRYVPYIITVTGVPERSGKAVSRRAPFRRRATCSPVTATSS